MPSKRAVRWILGKLDLHTLCSALEPLVTGILQLSGDAAQDESLSFSHGSKKHLPKLLGKPLLLKEGCVCLTHYPGCAAVREIHEMTSKTDEKKKQTFQV